MQAKPSELLSETFDLSTELSPESELSSETFDKPGELSSESFGKPSEWSSESFTKLFSIDVAIACLRSKASLFTRLFVDVACTSSELSIDVGLACSSEEIWDSKLFVELSTKLFVEFSVPSFKLLIEIFASAPATKLSSEPFTKLLSTSLITKGLVSIHLLFSSKIFCLFVNASWRSITFFFPIFTVPFS